MSTTAKAPPRNPPFRAEHLGSLLRPEKLLEKRHAIQRKEDGGEGLDVLTDECVKEAVEMQTRAGFRGISDGEYRRHMFWGDFWPSLNGMKEIYGPDPSIFRDYVPDIAAFLEDDKVPGESIICVGKISHPGKKYFADVAKAYRTELQILYNAGVRNVQVDGPNLAYFCSEKMLEGWKKDPANTRTTDKLFDAYIAFYNDCFKRPVDMHLGVHLCRGNFVGSRHFSEGGYDRIAVKLFNELNVSTYYLEYDTARAGGFEPLKSLPKDKNVVLGIITSKFPELEDKEASKERIYKAADFISAGSGSSREEALKQLGVSPQCGFASHEDGNLLGYEDMVKKLKLVRNIADEIWPGEP